jgi:hypothetical protein
VTGQYKVYRLRARGVKLAEDAIRATEVIGRIDYGQHPQYPNQRRVTLYDPTTGEVLNILEMAVLLKSTDGGQLFGGMQTPWGKKAVIQAWWCVPLG